LQSSPACVSATAIGRFHPCGTPNIECEYFPGRTPLRLRILEQYGPRPTGFCDAPTSSPSRPASFFDWRPWQASNGGRLRRNQYGIVSSGHDPVQKLVREDSRDRFAAATRARTSRCRMCAADPAPPAHTNDTRLAQSALSAIRRGRLARPPWFVACSSKSSLQSEQAACVDLRSIVPG
jgi:hypothetical protein